MKNNFFLKSILTSGCLCLLTGNAYAAPINLDRTFSQEDAFTPHGKLNPHAIGTSGLITDRLLGTSLHDFKTIIKTWEESLDAELFEYDIQPTSKKYHVVSIRIPGYLFDSYGVYILSENVVVGYCILDPMTLFNNFQSNFSIAEILSLNSTNNLSTQSLLGINEHIKTLEKLDGDYIERYSFLTRQKRIVDPDLIFNGTTSITELFLDSYYPKEIDENIKNNFVKRYIHDYLTVLNQLPM